MKTKKQRGITLNQDEINQLQIAANEAMGLIEAEGLCDHDGLLRCNGFLSRISFNSDDKKSEVVKIITAYIIRCLQKINGANIIKFSNGQLGVSLIGTKPEINIEQMVANHIQHGKQSMLLDQLREEIQEFEFKKMNEYNKTLQPRFGEEEDAVGMMQYAEMCSVIMAAIYFQRPNYDRDGLKIVDNYIEYMIPSNSHEQWPGTKNTIAAFLGECLIKKYNGNWFTWEGRKLVRINKILFIEPSVWVNNHLTKGNANSILKEFDNVPELIKEANEQKRKIELEMLNQKEK